MPPETRKNSSADYPVDPEERTSQQQRLKKAAAAGASALKGSMPSSMFGSTSSPAAAPLKISEPQDPIAHLASNLGNPEPAAVSQRLPEQKSETALTNQNDEILAELRKISAWAETQRTIARRCWIALVVLIPTLIGGGFFLQHRLTSNLDVPVTSPKPDWYDMDKAVRSGDFDKGIAVGEELILKTPQSNEAHQRLAAAYLASGNVEKAREHYAEAFRLFPSEENERHLGAIEKRIKSENP